MTQYEIKIKSNEFQLLWEDKRNYCIRKDTIAFREREFIMFIEVESSSYFNNIAEMKPTGRKLLVIIKGVTREHAGLEIGYIILSLKTVDNWDYRY